MIVDKDVLLQFENSEKSLQKLFDSIDKIKKENPNLIKYAKEINITNESCPVNNYYKSINPMFNGAVATTNCKEELITFYGSFFKTQQKVNSYDYATSVLAHESAHLYDNNNGNISKSAKWINAALKDGNFTSTYAANTYKYTNKYNEDFSEAIEYININGMEKFS